jgi:hypothetical protein
MTFGFASSVTKSPARIFSHQILLLTVLVTSVAITAPGSAEPARTDVVQRHKSEQAPKGQTPSYVDEPLDELIRDVPELRTLQPAADQQELAMILQKTGERVDEFSGRLGGLTAKEVVSEERLDPISIQQDQYTYFIVRKGTLLETVIEEYRRDADGNEGPPEVKFLSNGFASTLLYFSRLNQMESRFRYLGDEQVGTRSAYVVAFAQIPGVATVTVRMKKPEGPELRWLIQGIAWVDKSNFQILQVRTELLAPETLRTECNQKDQLQTFVKFSEVQPYGLAQPMWLPMEAEVREGLERYPREHGLDCKVHFEQQFRNVHHFTDYRTNRGVETLDASVKESEPKYRIEEIAQKNDAEAHPYLEEPLSQLIKQIPELKRLRPAPDQQALAMILHKTGARVDEFFANMVDLIAHEEITQEREISGSLPSGMPGGLSLAKEKVRDDYLILRQREGSHVNFNEFRIDTKGNRMDEVGLKEGFFVTSGFALSSVHFSTGVQWDSRFLYLGDQTIGGRDLYVVAFAQLPGEAHNKIALNMPSGITAHMLTQGIAWIDKETFYILQMQTDLLARQPEIGLNKQTTKVKFGEVRFSDVPAPLWLPRTVNSYIEVSDLSVVRDLGNSGQFPTFGFSNVVFRNVHRYTNYRRYRVSTKMVTPQ